MYPVRRRDRHSYSETHVTGPFYDAGSAAVECQHRRTVNGAPFLRPTATGPVDSGTGPGAGWDGGAVSFTGHIIPLIERSCGTANAGCHVREAYSATSNKDCRGWLSLENAALGAKFYDGANNGKPTGCPDRSLYDRLTQLDAWQEPGGQPMKYVTPNDPAKSYFYDKIGGGPVGEASPGVASESMPPKAPLGATDIAMVKKWIETGAPK